MPLAAMKSARGLEVDGAALPLKCPSLRHRRGDADDVEGLLPLTVRTARLITEARQPIHQVRPGLEIACSRRAATLELVRCQPRHDVAQVVRRDLAGGRLNGGGHAHRRRGPGLGLGSGP